MRGIEALPSTNGFGIGVDEQAVPAKIDGQVGAVAVDAVVRPISIKVLVVAPATAKRNTKSPSSSNWE